MKLLHFVSIIDHVKCSFFVFAKVGKGGAKAGPQKAGFRVMSKYFRIKKGFSLLYKTNRFHVAVRLFSNRSQKTSKCGKNISDTLGDASCATFLFLPHFDVICELLLNRRTATWNLFVKWMHAGSLESTKEA